MQPSDMSDAQLRDAWLRLAGEWSDCAPGSPQRQVKARVMATLEDERGRRDQLGAHA